MSLIEPKNVKEALLDDGWISAMQEELLQFERRKVYHLFRSSEYRTIIGTKWVI